MTDDLASIALCLALLGMLVIFPRLINRQYRGHFGRSYGLIVGELFSETERRGQLIGEIAQVREQRLERLERRLEQSR